MSCYFISRTFCNSKTITVAYWANTSISLIL